MRYRPTNVLRESLLPFEPVNCRIVQAFPANLLAIAGVCLIISCFRQKWYHAKKFVGWVLLSAVRHFILSPCHRQVHPSITRKDGCEHTILRSFGIRISTFPIHPRGGFRFAAPTLRPAPMTVSVFRHFSTSCRYTRVSIRKIWEL